MTRFTFCGHAISIVAWSANAIFSSAIHADSDGTREITVNVTLQIMNETPLEEYPISIRVPRNGKHFTPPGVPLASQITDDDGRATLQVTVQEKRDSVYVMLADGGTESNLSLERRRELAQRVRDLWQVAHVPWYVRVPLEQERSEYSVEYVVHPGVTVQGIIVDENEEPIGNSVMGSGVMQLSDARGRSPFVIRGVRRGTNAILLAVLACQMEPGAVAIVPIHLTEAQTQEDVHLGAVVIVPPPRNALANVNLSGFEGTFQPHLGITLVRADGEVLYAIPAYDERHERAGEAGGNPIELSAADYFVLPGYAAIGPSQELWELMEALRDGRDVSEWGLEAISLKEGEHQNLAFDYSQLQATMARILDK